MRVILGAILKAMLRVIFGRKIKVTNFDIKFQSLFAENTVYMYIPIRPIGDFELFWFGQKQ